MGGRGGAGGGYTAGMKTSVYNKIISMGGSRWTAGGNDRIYFNSAAEKIIGLSVERYKTGNISSATLNGERISNSRASKILASIQGMYYNVNNGKIGHRKGGEDYVDRMKEFIKNGK